MLKRIGLIVIILLIPLILTGCWNRRELNTLAIVKCIGVDTLPNGEYSLTVEVLKPTGVQSPDEKGSKGSATWVFTSKGVTLFDAVRNATFQSPRKLFWAQNNVIIVGQDAAKKGLIPLLDLYDRNHERRRKTDVFIASGTAKEIVEGRIELEKILGQGIEELARTTAATSKITKIDVHDLLKTLASKTSDPFVPGIMLNPENPQAIQLDDTAVFKKDKLIGWFDKKETRGLLWVLGKVSTAIIIIPSPLDQNGKISLEIMRTSSKVKATFVNGKPVISVNIEEEGNIGEQMSAGNLITPEIFTKLEEESKAVIQEEISAALKKAQQLQIDVFKFGAAFHREYPKEWKAHEKTWKEEFAELEVNVEIKAHIRRYGMREKPEKKEE